MVIGSRLYWLLSPFQANIFETVKSIGAEIVELDLSSNALDASGIKVICDFLTHPNSASLQILKLNNNDFKYDGKVSLQFLLSLETA